MALETGYIFAIIVITREEAIMVAMDACIGKGILAEFLKDNFEEVIDMLTIEYDQEDAYL